MYESREYMEQWKQTGKRRAEVSNESAENMNLKEDSIKYESKILCYYKQVLWLLHNDS